MNEPVDAFNLKQETEHPKVNCADVLDFWILISFQPFLFVLL